MCLGVDNMWRPCCKFRGQPRIMANKISYESFVSLPEYKKIKDTMKTGWHPGCVVCKNVEERGQESLRQISNKEFSLEEGIESIEFSLSNECNLRCRMCGPKYSTKWEELITSNYELLALQEHDPYNHFEPRKKYSVNQLLDGKDLSKLKMIKYLGGEPFLSREFVDLINYLDNINLLPNIKFHTNTNCTYFPSKLIKYISKFKRAYITLSIDGYGKLNEYIRDGRSWDSVEKTVREWKHSNLDNVELMITPSVQAYNVHDLTNIKRFADELNIKFKLQQVLQPEYFSLDALPREYLESIKDSVNEALINKSQFNNRLWDEFKRHTSSFDVAVNKNIKDYIPDLYRYFYV